jgi:hypothetical protein
MIDYLELGPVPNGESCVQVDSSKAYLPVMKKECSRYKVQLEKMFPKASFAIRRNEHDFGPYLEVAIRYDMDSEDEINYSYFVESHLPEKWEENPVEVIYEERNRE